MRSAILTDATQPAQCATALHHLITNAVFNISSDLMIILIPIPLLLRTHWPLKKKLILCVVFGLGGFTVSCTSDSLCKAPQTLFVRIAQLTWASDSFRRSQQILQLYTTIRITMDILVHSGVVHRNHRRQPASHVDAHSQSI